MADLERLGLRTRGECDIDAQHLLGVFARQRQRFIAVLEGFSPDDWAAPTRCSDWSAQDVVRHLCDTNAVAMGWEPDDDTLDVSAGFDPRVTPRGWLASSAGESPEATLQRFSATSRDLLTRTHARLDNRVRFPVRLPYGPMESTVALLHGFWDSWVHERDVLLAKGAEHSTDDDSTVYATAYGLFIAAAVASMFGDRVQQTLRLGGGRGGVFDLTGEADAVSLTVTRGTMAGPPAAQVADALAGRAPVADALPGLPLTSLTALSHLANYFNTPVVPDPA